MATAIYPNSHFENQPQESSLSTDEQLARDLEALCEAGLIEATVDQFQRVRYGVKAQ